MRHQLRPEKQAQTWSTDLMLAVGLFLLTFVVFYYIIGIGNDDAAIENLKRESNLIPLRLVADSEGNDLYVFIIDNKVDNERLRAFSRLPYREVKNILGLSHDFCIYFEDKDGNLINLSVLTGNPAAGIGSDRISISDIPCGIV